MGWVSGLISQRTFRFWALSAVLVVSMAALAGGIAYGTTTTCSNPATLSGSAFEVDTNANLLVNPSFTCIDWLDGSAANSPFRNGVIGKTDAASGSQDESFGNGAKEDTANPSIVDGGIPPNKSDLKAFGIYAEQGQVVQPNPPGDPTGNPTGKNLALFWTRVQDPSGTTNMDFELNQKRCGPAPDFLNCAGNHVTPQRTSGDKLITYDLSNGGTVATISIRTWNGSAWDSPSVISGGANSKALGSINTSLIPASGSGSPVNLAGQPTNASNQPVGLSAPLGSLDSRTFGEATIAFSALFGSNTCSSFGSAYLKSRSSDTFSSALKDFVPPQNVTISNCAALTTKASNPPSNPATIGGSLTDTATLSGLTDTAGGTITFKAYGPDSTPNDPSDNCSGTAAFTSNAITVNGNGDYTSGNFTPSTAGTYYWVASYSGDANNTAVSGSCNDSGETSVVKKAQANVGTAQELFPQDSATISATAGGTPTGTVHFALYGPNDPTCSGTPVHEETVGLDNGTANTDNTLFSVKQADSGNYKWLVTYSGDNTHEDATSACGKEAFTATIDNDTTN